MTALYLHIGSNKTATTTLQYRLARSPEALARVGVLYPGTGQSEVGAHHLLAGHLCSKAPAMFRPRGALGPLLAGIDREVSALAAPGRETRVLISSEMLFWLRRNDRGALADLFAGFSSVKVIAYLRRQDSYLPSFYSSVVSNGNRMPPFEVFCAEQDLDYLANLDAWADLVGADNVIARPFLRQHWVGGDIVRDLLTQLEVQLPGESLAASGPRNEALSAEAIEVLQAVNAGRSIAKPHAFREFLGEHFASARETPCKGLMTQALLEHLRERYDEGNRELGERYFARQAADALAFAPDEKLTADPYEPLDRADYGDLLAGLWEQSQQALHDRDQRLAELRGMWAQSQQVLRDRDQRLAEQEAIIAASTEPLRRYEIREEHLAREIVVLRGYLPSGRVSLVERKQNDLLQDLLNEDFAAIARELEHLAKGRMRQAQVPGTAADCPLPAQLPRREICHEDPAGCGEGCSRQRGEKTVVERLDYADGKFTVERHVHNAWACEPCATHGGGAVALPETGVYSPTSGLLAKVLVSRYADNLPLRAQEALHARAGFALTRPVLADWIGRCSVELLPLLRRLRERVLEQPVLQASALAVPLLSPGAERRRGSLWAFATSPCAPLQAVIYDFNPTDTASAQPELLAQWQGTLVCDAYRDCARWSSAGITLAGCWAQVQRQLIALSGRRGRRIGREARRRISLLYAVERQIADEPPEERQRLRGIHSRPLLEGFHQWLLRERAGLADGTRTSIAIDECLEGWDPLRRYLEDGALPMDNSRLQTRLHQAIPRGRNTLFATLLRSGQRAAMVMSLMETARMNDLDPQAYLGELLELLPATSLSDLDQLLPGSGSRIGGIGE